MFCITCYTLRGKKLLFPLKSFLRIYSFLKGTICRGEDERCCSRQEDFWSAAEKCWSVRSFLVKNKLTKTTTKQTNKPWKQNNPPKKPPKLLLVSFTIDLLIVFFLEWFCRLNYITSDTTHTKVVSLLSYQKGLWSILLKLPS